MNVIDQTDILQEIVFGIRNADILTTTQRGVVTTSVTGTINGLNINIPVSNVKNIRSLNINNIPLSYGSDYTVNIANNGVCTITFTTTQSGEYSILYDYGSDKIFSGYPRNDLSITSFPQIAVEFIDMITDTSGFGNVNEVRYDISIIAYDKRKEDVRDYIKKIRTWLINNQNSFYTMKLVKPTITGPIGISQGMKNRVFQQNQDFKSWLNYEKN